MRRRRFLVFGIAALAASLLPGPAARACPVFPADGELDFLVLRHGVAIGSHRIRFARAAGRFVVRSDIEFETAPPGAPPGAPLARYVHHAEEVWVGGWLHAVVSDTDDDGRRTRLRAEAMPGEDPTTLPHPDEIAGAFVDLAAPDCRLNGEIVTA